MPHKSTNRNEFVIRSTFSRSSLTIKLRTIRQVPREAKVCDFDVQIIIEQDVLGLQVPVSDVSRVYVVDAFEDLSHDVASLLLRQRHDRCEVVEELTVTAQLEHQEDEGIRLKHVLKFN